MATGFDKYWNDPKKHKKRLTHWLPHAKEISQQINGSRAFRYFTLCAKEMIDVFMLAKEQVLEFDANEAIITHVRFCESDSEQYDEIRELVGREDAGFYGELESLVLYSEDNYTAQFPTRDSIEAALEDEGLDVVKRDSLQTKRTHLNLKSSFPYDFINLDFCGYYYPPPSILKINRTVQQILDWQRNPGTTEELEDPGIRIDDFVLSVTCRHDSDFPQEAQNRLLELVKQNVHRHADYRNVLEGTRGVTDLNEWIEQNAEDFFLSSWPKEIATLAQQYQWNMRILDYVHYDRQGDGGPFKIICLVARFSRANSASNYLTSVMYALEESNRKLIPEITKDSEEGQGLMTDLAAIVEMRNQQALRKSRSLLPDPSH